MKDNEFVLITGDTHGPLDINKITPEAIDHYCNTNELDITKCKGLFILGDFGMIWQNDLNNDDMFRSLCVFYGSNQRPYPILAVLGNHENYNRIEQLDDSTIYDANTKRVTRNVHIINRGETLIINNTKFLVLGGAASHDKYRRKENISWWPQELWTVEEENNLLDKLKLDNIYDYVLSHTCPEQVKFDLLEIKEVYRERFDDPTERFHSVIEEQIEFKKWYFGHFHEDKENDKYSCLYFDIKHILV